MFLTPLFILIAGVLRFVAKSRISISAKFVSTPFLSIGANMESSQVFIAFIISTLLICRFFLDVRELNSSYEAINSTKSLVVTTFRAAFPKYLLLVASIETMFSLKFTVIVATLFAPVLAAPAPDGGAKPFTLKNGQDVIALNSACTDGDLACINRQFSQSGQSALLFLLLTSWEPCTSAGSCHGPPPADNQVSSGDKKSFALSNGKAAQVLNKFVLTGCAGGLQCTGLPLVNSPGTSITCVDNAQAITGIAATGAGSSLTGN
ncbi:hypothetical protein BU17DRAFT_71815 [Hysterangium stoloniferum]|nr:hypothetical protein BU17DRAFT_71815 [Hysterangium stoloniferum]